MNNWMIILIINFASAFIMFHIYWMMYASCELDNEYFRHPFFEPEIWDYKDIIGILIGLVIWALLGILLACWSAVLMMGKHDAVDIYVKTGEEAMKSKKWWKFWRWGMHILPKTFSPLYWVYEERHKNG